jgi:hypothetical protein
LASLSRSGISGSHARAGTVLPPRTSGDRVQFVFRGNQLLHHGDWWSTIARHNLAPYQWHEQLRRAPCGLRAVDRLHLPTSSRRIDLLGRKRRNLRHRIRRLEVSANDYVSCPSNAAPQIFRCGRVLAQCSALVLEQHLARGGFLAVVESANLKWIERVQGDLVSRSLAPSSKGTELAHLCLFFMTHHSPSRFRRSGTRCLKIVPMCFLLLWGCSGSGENSGVGGQGGNSSTTGGNAGAGGRDMCCGALTGGATALGALGGSNSGVGGTSASSTATGGRGGGSPCGPSACGAGQFCCNSACGICGPAGGPCPTITCAGTGGGSGIGQTCNQTSECGAGLMCCYPCGTAGCTNQCMQPTQNGLCPMFP